MLKIKDLRVNLEDENKEILRGVDLTVEAGKVHAIMGQMDRENLLFLRTIWKRRLRSYRWNRHTE